MPFTPEQARWVADVFGIEPPVLQTGAEHRIDPQTIWTEAKEAVDARLTALARILREAGDEQLDAIAETGLFALTDGQKTVALMTALEDYSGSANKADA